MKTPTRMKSLCARVDRALDRWLPSEKTKPITLHKAMRYSVFGGGKRVRPILCLAASEACGGTVKAALPAACAIECIHTYSLVHDDLPCMDDDDLRRGRATAHRKFGEAVAVLSGDALLTIAFEILAETKETGRYGLQDFYLELTAAAGSSSLVGGQVADLEAERKPAGPRELLFIHRAKTAAMIAASLRLGAMAADASPQQVKALGSFGESLGLAFQIVDDILDETQPSRVLGKSAGKDAAAGKATYPAVFGLEKSRREATRLTAKAHKALEPLGGDTDFLHGIADQLLGRQA
jgi:geranylgeranyl diphosphate synthase, type II